MATATAKAGVGAGPVGTFRQQLCGRKCLHYLFGSKHAHLDERMRQPNWTGQREGGTVEQITSETCQKAKTDVETSNCNSHTRQSAHGQCRAKAREIQGRSQPNPTLFLCQLRSRESVEALQHTIQLKTLFFLPFTSTPSLSFSPSLWHFLSLAKWRWCLNFCHSGDAAQQTAACLMEQKAKRSERGVWKCQSEWV